MKYRPAFIKIISCCNISLIHFPGSLVTTTGPKFNLTNLYVKQLNLQIAHWQLWSVSRHWHRRSHEDLLCFVTLFLMSKTV